MIESPPVAACAECGGEVRPTRGRGRFINYRRGVRLEIPADIETPTCGACGDAMLDGPTADLIEERLRTEYERMARFNAALELMGTHPPNVGLRSAGMVVIVGANAKRANTSLHAA